MDRDFRAEALNIVDNLGWQHCDSDTQMQIARHVMNLGQLVADMASEISKLRAAIGVQSGSVTP